MGRDVTDGTGSVEAQVLQGGVLHGPGIQPEGAATGRGPVVGTQTPVGLGVIAKVLGVPPKQVWAWHHRRRTSGFPEAVGSTLRPHYPGDKKKSPLFNLDAVVDWWITYDPNANRGEHWKVKNGEAYKRERRKV